MADSQRREGPAEWTLGERYRVGREIGRGSYGVVHRAVDLRSGREIALKLVDLERDGGPEDAATERTGAELQQRFGRVHPGFVPDVFEHGEISGYYAIAMELIDGPSLSQTIARHGPMSDERAARIALAIGRFLDKARRVTAAQPADGGDNEPIVHGDLKPQHVKVLEDGTIRVLDFGIAHGLSTSRTSATARGTSTHYASPELLETGRVRPQEDWWALGIMLFEMLAGVVPYHRYTLQPSLERAIRTGAPRDSLPPGTNPVLVAIVEKLLRPQPERRYPSAAAIVRDLSAFLDGEPTIAETEAATVATVKLPPPPPVPALHPSFDVPTLPVARPPAPNPDPATLSVTKHELPRPVVPVGDPEGDREGDRERDVAWKRNPVPAGATPRERPRMTWRRRLALIFGIPIGIAMLNGMCDNRNPRFAPGVGGMNLPVPAPGENAVPSPRRLDMEFVRIDPGEFVMGCSPGDVQCGEDESPRRVVRLTRAIQLGKYEVTVRQWAQVLGGEVRREEDRLPVIATWDDVQEFLARLNSREDGYVYRLPTEAEWEYAARAGTESAHGGRLDDIAWYDTGRLHDVGAKRRNEWGLHDMLGNAAEWVQDGYAAYAPGEETDPTGPATFDHRVVRGGDATGGAARVRVSARSYALPWAARGFRVARERVRR